MHVEYLAPQREDRLEAAVTTLLGRAARGIAFDEIQLGELGIGDAAVGQLAGEQSPLETAPLADQLARLASRLARPRCAHRLLDDGTCHARAHVENLTHAVVDDSL